MGDRAQYSKFLWRLSWLSYKRTMLEASRNFSNCSNKINMTKNTIACQAKQRGLYIYIYMYIDAYI